ncbi:MULTISPECIES: nitroreductase family protein [Acutalibacteraceae]|uniref:nitroreductase family protein n=1 Tax=Acutalibacteraceae TaxID=3082771 RepID=UPI0013E8B691|nr:MULTISPECIES: nitroreductase family protein [Acutalibacteraceae]
MNEVIKNMMERRSIRKYENRQVPDDILEQILYAASFSPNAGNRQTTQIVVCQDAAMNEQLGKIKKSLSHVSISSPGRYISTDQPSIADDPTIASAFYSAPTVVTLFGPKRFWFADADCYIMASNICLAAYSLGIGSCLEGVVEDIFDNEFGKEILRKWNVPEHLEAKAHITLGYPVGGFPGVKPRKYPNPIIMR